VSKTADAKLKPTLTYIKDLVQSEMDTGFPNKILLFAYRHQMLDGIMQVLNNAGVDYINIDGRTPNTGTTRQALVDRFQQTQSLRFAVLSIEAAGTGINLFKANMVIFAELTWNTKTLAQAEDRAHRNGQLSRVAVRYLVLDGSTDCLAWESMASKFKNMAAVLDNEQKTMQASKSVIRMTFDDEGGNDQVVPVKRKHPGADQDVHKYMCITPLPDMAEGC